MLKTREKASEGGGEVEKQSVRVRRGEGNAVYTELSSRKKSFKQDFSALDICRHTSRYLCGALKDVDERRVGGAPDFGDCGGGVLLSETFALPWAH